MSYSQSTTMIFLTQLFCKVPLNLLVYSYLTILVQILLHLLHDHDLDHNNSMIYTCESHLKMQKLFNSIAYALFYNHL